MTRLLLIRHGVTDWLEQGLLHGISDIPLNMNGTIQARLTAETLIGIKVNRLYSSPLSRAMQTAEEISKVTSLNIEPVEELKEMDFGWMEGKRDYWQTFKGKPILIVFYIITRLISGFFSGEQFGRFKQRVVNSWEEIVLENPTGTVIIVAHAGVLRIILAHEFGGSPFFGPQFSLTPCGVSEIESDQDGNMRLIEVSRDAHLSGDELL